MHTPCEEQSGISFQAGKTNFYRSTGAVIQPDGNPSGEVQEQPVDAATPQEP